MIKKEFFFSIGIILIVLIGYFELFGGANVFVEEDPKTVFDYTHGNAMGNGWRPDKGLGISFFYGDPGLWHAWSIYTLWERIAPTPEVAFNFSIIFLLITAALSQYYFLKKIVPEIGVLSLFIAPLIVFGPLQHEFYFQRHWITLSIGTPLLLLMLNDYFGNPRPIHFFQVAFLFWFVWFFGSFASFFQLIIVGMLFAVLYLIYHKPGVLRLTLKFLALFAWGGFWTFLLGAWIFYSVYMENSLVGYVRESVYVQESGLIQLKYLAGSIISLFHAGWLPGGLVATLFSAAGLPVISWTNCSVIFPIVMIYFLFGKTKNFWEFILKWLIIILLLNELFRSVFPIYGTLLQSIVNGYPLGKFQPSYHVMQIGLIGLFLSRIISMDRPDSKFFVIKSQQVLAWVLFVFYGCLGLFLSSVLISPNFISSIMSKWISFLPLANVAGYPKMILPQFIPVVISLFQESLHWYSIIFYFLSAALMLAFVSPSFLVRKNSKLPLIISVTLLINGIMLSWTVYPLNKTEPVWDQNKNHALTDRILPTDRLYYVCDESQISTKDMESFKDNWLNEAGNVTKNRTGYLSAPALNFSATKSFSQKLTADFTMNIFNGDGQERINSMRQLSKGPLVSSELLDMCAISYYYSYRRFPEHPANLVFVGSADRLFLYKNVSAWPYYYLADRIELYEENEWILKPVPGTAYIKQSDLSFNLSPQKTNSHILLKEFRYGQMTFDYRGEGEEFLVVADAWHPFWRARIDNTVFPVIRANGIFKGIKLPPGNHTITLFFDTLPYHPGIYISIASWILFAGGFIFVVVYRKDLGVLQKKP